MALTAKERTELEARADDYRDALRELDEADTPAATDAAEDAVDDAEEALEEVAARVGVDAEQLAFLRRVAREQAEAVAAENSGDGGGETVDSLADLQDDPDATPDVDDDDDGTENADEQDDAAPADTGDAPPPSEHWTERKLFQKKDSAAELEGKS
jgi:hypothetical protein